MLSTSKHGTKVTMAGGLNQRTQCPCFCHGESHWTKHYTVIAQVFRQYLCRPWGVWGVQIEAALLTRDVRERCFSSDTQPSLQRPSLSHTHWAPPNQTPHSQSAAFRQYLCRTWGVWGVQIETALLTSGASIPRNGRERRFSSDTQPSLQRPFFSATPW